MSIAKCAVCGEPMPQGEEMFKFHGYSGPCSKPPLPRKPTELEYLRISFEHECQDVDRIIEALGISDARTEGGSLNLPKILARIADLMPNV